MFTDSQPLPEGNRQGVLEKHGDTAKAHTPATHSTSEGAKAIELQQQILNVLRRMCEEMQGQQDEQAGNGRTVSERPSNQPFKKTCFGIPRQRFDQGQQSTSTGNEDYEQIFPEDAYGDEAGPNARVFRVYNEEATVQDNDMVGKSNDSSDVLLVFAGLFSAVLTTFVAQTSQALETDKIAISNSLLLELVQLQRAQASGSSVEDVHSAFTETSPTSNDVWVNGLWFTSLTLSLATALFAVLTKQWLRQYVMSTSGTIRDRSLVRQFRFAGMQKWHVVGIIGLLPILLHLALGIFLAGLIVFLLPRCLPLAYIVGSITVIVYSLYFISNLIPIFDIQCPFRTPLSDILNFMHYRFGAAFTWSFRCALNAMRKYLHQVLAWIPEGREIPDISLPTFQTLRQREHAYVQEESVTGSLSLDSIAWLMRASSNPSVHSVAVQGVGGLPPSQREKVKRSIQPSPYFIEKLVKGCLASNEGEKIIFQPKSTHRLERVLRMCPIIFDRDHFRDLRREAYWRGFYVAFRDMDDIKGMVSALPMALIPLNAPDATVISKILAFLKNERAGVDPTELFNLITRLLRDSSKLSPKAWINLFSEVPDRWTDGLQLADICAKALEDNKGWKDPTWDGVTAPDPVPVSLALSRDPKLVLWVFKQYDPFQSTNDLYSHFPHPPDSVRLRALLTLHHFLEVSASSSSTSDTQKNSLTRHLQSVWQGISNIVAQEGTTMNDCSTIFQVGHLCVVESPLLMGHGWMVSRELSRYCGAVLRACRIACVYAGTRFGVHHVRRWKWTGLLDRITRDLAFNSAPVTISFPMYSIRLWKSALECNVQDAYRTFVDRDTLRHGAGDYSAQSVVKSFILGLARNQTPSWNLCPSQKHEWLSNCMEYLHDPDNLLSACQTLVKHTDASSEDILILARLHPDNAAWSSCPAKLRKWHPFWPSDNKRLHDALGALDSFFESRRRRKEFLRRLNPIILLCNAPRRADMDLEGQGDAPESGAAHSPFSESDLQDLFEERPIPGVGEVVSSEEPTQSHTDQAGESTPRLQPVVTVLPGQNRVVKIPDGTSQAGPATGDDTAGPMPPGMSLDAEKK